MKKVPKTKKEKEPVKVDKEQQKKPEEKVEEKPVIEVKKKQPELEDGEGFDGRRPENDPFGVGERIVLSVKYFAMSAGELTLESRSVVEVNGRLSYHFAIGVKTHSFFLGSTKLMIGPKPIWTTRTWFPTILRFTLKRANS